LDQGVATSSSLKIDDGTMARKVLFKDYDIASGALVTTGNEGYILSALKEVILSVGAFQSLQLLMVPGVGPAGIL